jgi:hypothetical protein
MSSVAEQLKTFRALARALIQAEIEGQDEEDHVPFHEAIEIGRAALIAEIDAAYDDIMAEYG